MPPFVDRAEPGGRIPAPSGLVTLEPTSGARAIYAIGRVHCWGGSGGELAQVVRPTAANTYDLG